MSKPDKRGPGRALELLWGQIDPPSRGPKPALSLGEIVHAGIAIADRSGLAALTMRRVAERLGFTTMSLYRYVPGKDELVDVMRDTAIGEPPAPDSEGEWRVELARWARANLALHVRHPWMLEMEIVRPVFGPNHLRWLDAGLHTVSSLGFPDSDALSVVLVVDSYVRGAARTQVSLMREQRRSPGLAAELDKIYARIFETVATSERYPTLAKVVMAGGLGPQDPPRDEFEVGLQCVLDGIEAMVRELDPAPHQGASAK